MQDIWTKVDEYLESMTIAEDETLQEVLLNNSKAGLPTHDVAPNQGKLLNLLIQVQGAIKVLEIGTLGGYSTIWMARALSEGGKLVTIEADEHHADIARENIESAGLSNKVEVVTGKAVDVLPTLMEVAPFDLIFIDADKPSNPVYLEWALKLSKTGTVIIGDNVVREGKVADNKSNDPKVKGVRSFFELIKESDRLDATVIQTVGSKGYDGFVLARVVK